MSLGQVRRLHDVSESPQNRTAPFRSDNHDFTSCCPNCRYVLNGFDLNGADVSEGIAVHAVALYDVQGTVCRSP